MNLTVRHKIGSGKRVVRQPNIAIDDTVPEGVQLTINLDLVIISLRTDLTSKLLAQSTVAQYNKIQLVVFRGQLPLTTVVPRGRPVSLCTQDSLDQCVHAVRKGRTVFADRTVYEA